jgi:hypothetical protein
VIEQKVSAETRIGSRPIERHPDGHKKEPKDSRDANFGRSFGEQEGKDRLRIQAETEARRARDASEPPPVYFSVIKRLADGTEIEVNLGCRGYWLIRTIQTKIEEEELNELISGVFGVQLATPDYSGVPSRDQEFRSYRELSGDDKIWINLRLREPRKSLTVRVSLNTSQEAIEQAASEEWEMKVGSGTKFPSVSESNGCYSLKRIIERTNVGSLRSAASNTGLLRSSIPRSRIQILSGTF